MEKVKLNVKGMSCQHCVKAVESALEAVDGVSSVKVKLSSGKAIVSYDGAKTNVDALKAAINAQGYQADE